MIVRRWSIALVVLVLTLLAAPAAQADMRADVTADANWLMQAVMTNADAPGAAGAIGHYIDRVKIRPYMAHFAALGLIRATAITGDPRYANAAWNWLNWYAAHMYPNGHVHDYDIVNGVLTDTGNMDSTDSYAALFIYAAREAYRVTGNYSQLSALRSAIELATDVMRSTQDTDGLTWAKPGYYTKYLMDNSEVWLGYASAYELAGPTVLNDSTLRTRAQAGAQAVTSGIASLWNSGASPGYYYRAKFSGGTVDPTSWSTLFPDALSQAWVVSMGVPIGSRGLTLMNTLDAQQPNWALPNVINPSDPQYFPQAVWGEWLVGNATRAQAASNSIRSAAVTTNGRAWPFSVDKAGALIVAESGAPNIPAAP